MEGLFLLYGGAGARLLHGGRTLPPAPVASTLHVRPGGHPVAIRRSPLDKLLAPRSPREILVRRLVVLTAVIVVVDLLSALAFYYLERGAPGTEITTYGDALFWTSSQLSSVSSSIANPLTTGARILAVALDFISIGVVTVLIAALVNHFHLVTPGRDVYFERHRRRSGADAPDA